jgi:putative ABC transport system permease protein
MTLPGFALKNATVTWWRSLTLGAFIFAIAFVMTLFGSFSTAVKERVDNVVVGGLTGHIQVRSDKSQEQDIVEFYNAGWDDIATLPASTVGVVTGFVRDLMPGARLVTRARRSVSLIHGTKREQSLLIGVEPGEGPSEEAFIMASGRSPDLDGSREIMLTQEQAKNLKASVGDTIQVVTRNAQGRISELDFAVAGVGDFVMLSLFSYKACFADISSARDLIGLAPEEATDLLIYLPDGGKAVDLGRRLAREIDAAGLTAVFQADAKLSSSVLSSEEGKLPGEKKPDKIRISTWQDMGKTFRGVGDAISVALTMLVVFIMIIVSILIVNLVSLMGMERYREIGTLRAIGYSRGLVIRLFMTEIMGVATAATCIGACAGVLLVLVLGKTGVPSPIPAMDFIMGKILYPRLSAGGVASTLAIIWLFAFVASLIPALRACSLQPAQTLREE